MDVIGLLIRNTGFSNHIEPWNIYYQFSSQTTQLFWVFNQAIPVWVGTLLFLQTDHIKFDVFIGALLILFSPLPIFGCFALILFKILFNEIYTNPEDVSSDIFNSNLFIAGLMNLQNVNEWDIIDQIISKYVQGKSVFYVFLLNKFNNIGEIDSKYVSFICNQMASTICNDKISSAQTITLDFEKYFNKKWINTKSGKNLLMGYLNANISNSQKALFF